MATDIKRETYQEALWRICQGNDDELSIDAILSEARDPLSPLHSHFEWNDAKAGEAYRRVQARRLVVGVRTIVTETTELVRVPVYMRDPSKDQRQQGYVPTAKIKGINDWRRQSMQSELKRAEALILRAHNIAGGFGLDATTGAILQSLRELQDALASVEVAA